MKEKSAKRSAAKRSAGRKTAKEAVPDRKVRAKRGRYISDTIVARRRHMLDVAKRMIAEGDPEGFTIRDLGRLAGVSVTTIYATYGDKEGIIAAAIEDFYQSLPFADRPAPTSLAGILDATDEATRAVFENPPYARHYADLYFSPTVDPRIHKAIRDTANAGGGYTPWLQRMFRENQVLPGVDLDWTLATLANNRLVALRDWEQGRIAPEHLSHASKVSFLTIMRGIMTGDTLKRIEAELRKCLRVGPVGPK